MKEREKKRLIWYFSDCVTGFRSGFFLRIINYGKIMESRVIASEKQRLINSPQSTRECVNEIYLGEAVIMIKGWVRSFREEGSYLQSILPGQKR